MLNLILCIINNDNGTGLCDLYCKVVNLCLSSNHEDIIIINNDLRIDLQRGWFCNLLSALVCGGFEFMKNIWLENTLAAKDNWVR